MSFPVDVSSYKNWQDIKSDMKGAYLRVLRVGTWTLALEEDGSVQILQKMPLKTNSELHIHINSKSKDFGLCRSIFFLRDSSDIIMHEPFYPTSKSTLESMKDELRHSAPSVAFKKIVSESGGLMRAQNPGELPKSSKQMYDLKYNSRKADDIAELLFYSKQKDGESLILEHHDVPEDVWILGKKHMCQDLLRFFSSKTLSHPFSVDPTFNFGHYEVTPFSYKHLLLKSKRTKDAHVFIGTAAIHYSKNKNTFRRLRQQSYPVALT